MMVLVFAAVALAVLAWARWRGRRWWPHLMFWLCVAGALGDLLLWWVLARAGRPAGALPWLAGLNVAGAYVNARVISKQS